MYIYHALVNALSDDMIHINLITHVEDSPPKTIYIRHNMDTHTRTRAKILWEEEGFQKGRTAMLILVADGVMDDGKKINTERTSVVGEKGVWRWGKRDNIYLSLTVTTRMIPALRWTAMRAILMFQ